MTSQKVVITTFKNEAPYILEWVAHYKILGFDHILVFTNDCTDGTNEILTRLDELGEVTFRNNRVGAGGVHRSALRQARRMEVVKNADWVFVCDIDEFLNIHVGDHKIDDLIEATGDNVDIISVPWKIFSNNGRNILRNAPVTRQFTDAELPPVAGGATRRFVKSIFKPNEKLSRIGLHGPVLREEFKNDLVWSIPGGARTYRNQLPNHIQPPFGYDVAQLNHYAVRSVESYLLKRYRGRANHKHDVLDTEYWDRWNRGGEEDTSIHRYLPELEQKLAGYHSDPTLSQLHKKGFQWHKQLLVDLRTQEDYAALKSKAQDRKTLIPDVKERPARPARAPEALVEVQARHRGHRQPAIGSLWTGPSLSYLEQMCLLSFARHGHPVTLFSYHPVRNVPDEIAVADAREIFDADANGELMSQGEFEKFRVHLLHKTDMIWADGDMFCLKPVSPVGGHLHGYASDNEVGSGLLRLPQGCATLSEYLQYVSDPQPAPPWWPEEKRKQSTETDRMNELVGTQALTWFLMQSGDIQHSQEIASYYPLAAEHIELLTRASGVEATCFTDATQAVHLSGQTLRPILSQGHAEKHSFIHAALTSLEINPDIAPIETVVEKHAALVG